MRNHFKNIEKEQEVHMNWENLSLQKRYDVLLSMINGVKNIKLKNMISNSLTNDYDKLKEHSKQSSITGELNEYYYERKGTIILYFSEEIEFGFFLSFIFCQLLISNKIIMNNILEEYYLLYEKDLDLFRNLFEQQIKIESLTQIQEKLEKDKVNLLVLFGNKINGSQFSKIVSKRNDYIIKIIHESNLQTPLCIIDQDRAFSYCNERVKTTNLTAIGGNTDLLEI